uniref:CCDC66 domain-containing protein n=1 Tax=Rodentolepis nana TaxID=102285 RepID=A0A0R3TKY2_RODNA
LAKKLASDAEKPPEKAVEFVKKEIGPHDHGEAEPVKEYDRTPADTAGPTNGTPRNGVRFGRNEIIDPETNQPVERFNGYDDESGGDYNPPQRYTELPERDYYNEPQRVMDTDYKPFPDENDYNFENDALNQRPTNDSGGNQVGWYPRNGRFDKGDEKDNNRYYERQDNDYGYREWHKDENDFRPPDLKVRCYKQETPSIDENKLNQLIDLINEMPKYRDKTREGKVQMQPQRGRPKEYSSGRWESCKGDDGDNQSNNSVRLNGSTRKKFNWPKLRKSKAQADYQQEIDRDMNENLEVSNRCREDMDIGPSMVPRARCNSGGNHYSPRRSCSRGDTPGIGISSKSSFQSSQTQGDCDYDERFNAGMNEGYNERCPRRRRFSENYEDYYDDDYKDGMNEGYKSRNGMNFNNEMRGTQRDPNFEMNGRMNNEMDTGMQGDPNEEKSSRQPENQNDTDSVCNLDALNGLCASLNALNGALGGLSGTLGKGSSNVGAGMTGNMGMTGGINGMTMGVNMQNGGGIMNPRGRMNLGGQNAINDPLISGANANYGVQGGFSGPQRLNDNLSGSMLSLLNSQGGKWFCNSNFGVNYPGQPNWPFGNNRSNSLPPGGYRGGVGSNLNIPGMNDFDYEIQYIEPDMKEYNRKVKEAKEKAERKRQELIRQRDEEVAKKRAELEKKIEEEYERKKAEAERQREAQIKKRMSEIQGELKKQEHDLMQQFCKNLKTVRDAEAERRRKYELAFAETNQRSETLKQQLAMARQQMQELEMLKFQLHRQEAERRQQLDMLSKQIQFATQVPSYQSDTTMEKNLLADFSQKMRALKTQEQKLKESVANVPMPHVEKPQMPQIPIPISAAPQPEVMQPYLTAPTAPAAPIQQQYSQVMPSYQTPCLPAPQQMQSYCAPAMPMMPMQMMGCYAPYTPCSACCMPKRTDMTSMPICPGPNVRQSQCCPQQSCCGGNSQVDPCRPSDPPCQNEKVACTDYKPPKRECPPSECCMKAPKDDCVSEDEIYELKSADSTECDNDCGACESEEECSTVDCSCPTYECTEEKSCEDPVPECAPASSCETLKNPDPECPAVNETINAVDECPDNYVRGCCG